jgi:hypothetical protein
MTAVGSKLVCVVRGHGAVAARHRSTEVFESDPHLSCARVDKYLADLPQRGLI